MAASKPRNPVTFLRQLTRKASRRDAAPWHAGQLAPNRANFLLIDGLASWSYAPNFPPFVPWLRPMRPILRAAKPEALARGLSYAGRKRHYGPINTDIFVLDESARLCRPYLPSGESGQRVVYLGFSLGGSVATIGLAAHLRDQSFAGGELAAAVSAVVLVQPAFALGMAFREAAVRLLEGRAGNAAGDSEEDEGADQAEGTDGPEATDELEVPAPLAEFVRYGTAVRAELLAAAGQICSAGIPTYVLCWRDDQFTTYPDDLIADLEALGVTVRDLPDPPPPRRAERDPLAPFKQHVAVAGHAAQSGELQAILSALP